MLVEAKLPALADHTEQIGEAGAHVDRHTRLQRRVVRTLAQVVLGFNREHLPDAVG